MTPLILAVVAALAQPPTVDHRGPSQEAAHTQAGDAPAKPPPLASTFNPLAPTAHTGADEVKGHHESPSPGEWGLIFVGALQAIVLAWQIRFLGRTLRHQRKAARLELRAYIAVVAVRFDWNRDDKQWLGQVKYRNLGATPAYNVTVRSKLEVKNTGDPDPDWTSGRVFSVGVVGPHGDRFWDEASFEGDPRPSLRSLRAALRRGAREVFLFGRIDYVDEFDKPRTTHFRYSIGGELKFPDSVMSACEDGNYTEKHAPAQNQAHG